MDNYKLKLSKFLSYILRHAPDKYDLELDRNGYADLEKVIEILSKRFKHFKREDLSNLVKSDPKDRFEIIDDRIRATYGHSIDVYLKDENMEPPEVLYHGTSRENTEKILREGLKPMGRKFVHLSTEEEDARSVGLRHTKDPIILEIMAKEANNNGIKFFKAGVLFLAEFIPKEFIHILKL
jgi:putative RNA 2'-phosphotransferase